MELSARARWWVLPVFVAVFVAAFAVWALVIGQAPAGLALLLLAGQTLASRYHQLLAFRDGWHTANCVPRPVRRPLEPWDPIPPPTYPEPPRLGGPDGS